ncbi:MAG TPA: polysaccharide deacetylase [Actinomycetota bacterium]|nr:polysaccharide deacetylase [Actinomycetota bacterium]
MWPERKRFAVAFSFDFDAEEVWIGENPDNARRPGVLSQGRYGAKVGVPRILDVLARHRVRATFFVPGRVAERHSERVKEIVGAGHELAHHGYRHVSPAELDYPDEEAELVRGKEALAPFGAEVVGYRSPSWDLSPHTLELLELHGFLYSSNLMDDVRPYRHDGCSVVELPIQWVLDDAAHFWFGPAEWTKKISTTSEVRQIWEEELLGIREMGGCFVLTMHPQIIGRPSRVAFLDRFVGFVKSLNDGWIATCAEVARRVR